MNNKTMELLKNIAQNDITTQRELSNKSNYSLGMVNKLLKNLISENLITDNYRLTKKGKKIIQDNKPRNAIILAAGYGMRMVPLNFDKPKALLEVKGEVLIERLIKSLHSVGIYEIYVVVGFMKESFEYLIDSYGVTLITNPNYMSKNNIYSLSLVKNKISNTYIIPCDLYCFTNPFSSIETNSWYMISDAIVNDYPIQITRNNDLVLNEEIEKGYKMIGIAYLNKNDSLKFVESLTSMINNSRNHSFYWEEALMHKNKMLIPARLVNDTNVVEINTFENLRDIDFNSNSLNSNAIKIIENVFKVDKHQLSNVNVLKKGMTNRSFIFECKNNKYIMRIPGEGTEKLINRVHEFEVYSTLKGKNISDEIIYFNPNNGYKITKFIEGCRNCNLNNHDDIVKCMKLLKKFHSSKCKVDHYFDIFEKIEYYQSLWKKQNSCFQDYETTKSNVLSLKSFITSLKIENTLTHIDAIPDNFLIYNDDFGKEHVRLIDWEYASMQDPHIDIAMFSIYSLYNKEQIDDLIDIYFENNCDNITRVKIYAYISICGLLWSNWCEYKRDLGIEFGEYSISQYRYAKDYYRIFVSEVRRMGFSWK